MSLSKISAVIDHLLARLTAHDYGDLSVVVSDGLPAKGGADNLIGIGCDSPDHTGPYSAADTLTDTWAAIGAQRWDEVFTVRGYISALAGGSTPKLARDRAVLMWEAVITVVMRDPTFHTDASGNPQTAILDGFALLTGGDVTYLPTAKPEVRIPFSITCKTRVRLS